MLKWIFIALSFLFLSAGSEKIPRKYRGAFQGTLLSSTLGTGNEQLVIAQASAELIVTKQQITLVIEGRRFVSGLNIEAVTKQYAAFRAEFPSPLKQSVFRFYKKGKKVEWVCPGLETVVFVKR